jgi:hypothetical protein
MIAIRCFLSDGTPRHLCFRPRWHDLMSTRHANVDICAGATCFNLSRLITACSTISQIRGSSRLMSYADAATTSGVGEADSLGPRASPASSSTTTLYAYRVLQLISIRNRIHGNRGIENVAFIRRIHLILPCSFVAFFWSRLALTMPVAFRWLP